jgi:hypothetical protein
MPNIADARRAGRGAAEAQLNGNLKFEQIRVITNGFSFVQGESGKTVDLIADFWCGYIEVVAKQPHVGSDGTST